MEVIEVTVDIFMGMVIVIMDMVTMVINKHLQTLLQSVFGTSIYLFTHSQNKARHEFSE
jgi:hypothetical protein